MYRRFQLLLFSISLLVVMDGPIVQALDDTVQMKSGEQDLLETGTSKRLLNQGDVLLVGIKPVSGVDFVLVGPGGAKLDGVSFEHMGADRRLAFLIKDTGEHKLVLRPQASQSLGDALAKSQDAMKVDVVKSLLSPDEKLDRIVQHWDSDSDPGAVLTLTQGGSKSLVLAFGCANVEHQARVNASTVFDTASLAKHVLGFVIASLAREGSLSLDDDIRKHIPEVPDFGQTITLRHLLHHTSGLRDFPGLMILGDWHDYDVITLDQVIELVRNQQDLNFAPGSEYTYSNTGYSLLAETVHRVTGKPLAQWSDEHLFSPLGMRNTRFLTDIRTLVPNRAHGYSLAGPNELLFEPNNLAAMGSSSFLTTGEDMLIWMKNFDSHAVAKEAFADLMTVQGKLANGDSVNYGFGLGHGEHRGLRRVEHGGASGGFRSHLLRFPAQQFSVSVFSNQGNFDPASFAYFAAELYLVDQMEPPTTLPRKDAKPGQKQAPKSTTEITVSPETLDKYTGVYQVNPNEVISITREGKQLAIRPKGHPDVKPIIAKPLTQTRFTGPPNGSLEFVIIGTGAVTKALMRQGEEIIGEAKKLSDVNLSETNLEQYEGRYFSPELDVHYQLQVDDGKLVARQAKRTRTWHPVMADRFRTNDGIAIQISRDSGKITGFKATTGQRVRNVRFEKE